MAARATAKLFRVSVSYIYKALIRRRRTGEVSASTRRGRRPRTMQYAELVGIAGKPLYAARAPFVSRHSAIARTTAKPACAAGPCGYFRSHGCGWRLGPATVPQAL